MCNEDGVTLDSLHLTSKPELSVCPSASLIIGISQPKNCSVIEATKSMIACDEEVKEIKKSRKVACDEEVKEIKKSRKVACDEEVKEIKKSRKVACDEEVKQIKKSRKVACDEEVKQIKKSRKVACDEEVKQIKKSRKIACNEEVTVKQTKKSRKVACDKEVKQIKKSRKVACDMVKQILKKRKVRTQDLSNLRHQWLEVGNVTLYDGHRCILESDKKWLDDAIINAVQYLLHSQYSMPGFQATTLGYHLTFEIMRKGFIQNLHKERIIGSQFQPLDCHQAMCTSMIVSLTLVY